jgi:hypothetical protein
MGVVELIVISAIAAAFTAAQGTKTVLNASANLVHARKGTKPAPRKQGGFGKWWNQFWDDAAAKHAVKEQRRRDRLADGDHVTVGDWWAKMCSEGRKQAMARRGLDTEAKIARAARRHRDRLQREGLTPFVPGATSPDAGPTPTVPDLQTTEPSDADAPTAQPTPDASAGPEPGEGPFSPFAPTETDQNTVDSARSDVEDLTERLKQAEADLAQANADLDQARRDAATSASREGLAGYADATRDHQADMRHAEAVAQRLAEDRARLAAELAEAQQRLDLIAKAWEARQSEQTDSSDEPTKGGDGFDGVVIDGEVVDPSTETTTETSGAPAALEHTRAIANETEHHMTGEITTLETTRPFVQGMGTLAGEAGSAIEAAAASHSRRASSSCRPTRSPS